MHVPPEARPIIFRPDSVRAILDGRKSQTRRVLKPQPEFMDTEYGKWWYWSKRQYECDSICSPWPDILAKYAPHPPGSLLWVREGWTAMFEMPDTGHVTWYRSTPKAYRTPEYLECLVYKADDDGAPSGPGYPWRSPIHMPKWACRLLLEVTQVRVQRLQDISEDDAIAEGCEQKEPDHVTSARYRFGQMWNEINRRPSGRPSYPWESNPFIFAYTFKVAEVAR